MIIMKAKKILLCFLLSGTLALSAQKPIKVACVGNSVTYGYGIENREHDSYPAQLQRMLGDEYQVENFGKSGATLLSRGHRPYTEQEEYCQALAFAGDLVIIHLGLNDTDPRNWPAWRDDFTRDYIRLIHDFKRVNPNAKVWISLMTPILPGHPRFKSSTRDWYWQIQAAIRRVAEVEEAGLIDLNTPLRNRSDLFPDALHPVAEGAGIIAKTVYQSITGDFGGLQLPALFTNHMVMQRNRPIRFWGTANAHSQVSIRFAGTRLSTTAAANGKWRLSFPAMNAGGPYKAVIKNESRVMPLSDILIGEVWICSGQSNMAFELKHATTAGEDMAGADQPRIRLFNMRPVATTHATVWEDSTLTWVNRLQYYKPAVWEICDAETAKDFSAVGYHFGRMLHENLNVPVGLIHNAIGGSPAEAWIDRMTMEKDPLLVDFFNNWENNDFIDGWVRQRGALNIRSASNPLQQHPYKPAYLYETAIAPFEDFPIAGAIWYQGESNAGNVELHEKIFPKLVHSWRKRWGSEFPFYYVQLSGIEGRPTWGHFRDSQRRLMQRVPNSGMAVSSDVGNKTDVHPRNKKPVGERLARWALADHYSLPVAKSGPLFQSAAFAADSVVIRFTYSEGLKTADKLEVKAFELAGNDKIFHPAQAAIRDDVVMVKSRQVAKPVFVRYGWSSYSEGNLVNEAGLPASTFSVSKRDDS